MSDRAQRLRHPDVVRAEISEVLRTIAVAGTAEDIAFTIARSICRLSRAQSVFFIAAVEGTEDEDALVVGSFGSGTLSMDYEYLRSGGIELITFGDFRKFARSFGWNDLSQGFIYELTDQENGFKFHCRRIVDQFGFFSGFLVIKSDIDPFQFGEFEASMLVLAMGALRLSQSRDEYGAQSVIIQKIVHDINGSLAVIGLQTELLQLKANIEDHFVEAQQRIKSALKKADENVRRINEFSHLFFAERQDAKEYKKSSVPLIALRAALATLPISKEQLSQIDVSVSIDESVRVGIEGISLYWIYRALLAAWANQKAWGELDPLHMSVELRLSGLEQELVTLVLNRRMGHEIDQILDASRDFPFGPGENEIVLIPPTRLMEEVVELFGGFSSVETVAGIRSVKVAFSRT